MKKQYFRPELDIVSAETESLLAVSLQVFDGDGLPTVDDPNAILAPALLDVEL